MFIMSKTSYTQLSINFLESCDDFKKIDLGHSKWKLKELTENDTYMNKYNNKISYLYSHNSDLYVMKQNNNDF